MSLSQTDQTAKTAVRYNRSTRQWQAINGTTTSHPTKGAALIYALRHDHPVLAARIDHIAVTHNDDPAVVSRLLKAAALVAKGKVDGQTVYSQTTDRSYQVTFRGTPKRWSCTCQDFANGGTDSNYGRMCKHTFAALLNYLVNGSHATPTTF